MTISGRGRLVRPALGAVVGTGIGYWAPALTAVAGPARTLFGVRNRLEAQEAVMLTFDDGPHPQGTEAVLELLAAAKARATFFLVGEQVERYPRVARLIALAGHDIGFHCYRHRCLARLTPRQVVADFERGMTALADIVGEKPVLYRPPYGVLTSPALVCARERDLVPLLWSREGHDWQRRASPLSIASRVTRNLSAGDVILLHDADHYSASMSWHRTLGALPSILRHLAQRQLRLVSYPDAAVDPKRLSR